MPSKLRVASALFAIGVSAPSFALSACVDRQATAPVVEAPVATASPAASSSTRAPAPADDTSAASKIAGDRSDLSASLEVAIAMLEAQRYRDFLNEFVAPDDRVRFEKDGGMEKILPDFISEKAQSLLQMLNQLRDQAPTLEGDEAKYDLPGAKMTWVKSGGRWYIRN